MLLYRLSNAGIYQEKVNISTQVITCRYERNILERDVQRTTTKTKSAQNFVELTLLKQFYLEDSIMKHLYYSMNTVLAVELQKRALYTLHDEGTDSSDSIDKMVI